MQDVIYYNTKLSSLYSLFGYLKPTICYIYAPITSQYEYVVKKYHFTINHINIYTDINQDLEAKSVVVFSNPNYIDGSYYNIDKLFKTWINKDITIVVDESFLQFTSNSSIKEFLKLYPNLYIISSINYFYPKYNSDITTLTSTLNNIQNIKQTEQLEQLSSCNTNILDAMKKDISYNKVYKVLNITKKEKIYRILEQNKDIKNIFNSFTNRILIDTKIHLDKSNLFDMVNIKDIMFLDNSYQVLQVNN